jgi:tRNA(fMet)-specific endonuclease VapC
MRYMLDTHTCIFIIRRKPEHVFDRLKTLRVGDVGISSIVLSELQFGVAKSGSPERNQKALTEFLGPLELVDFPCQAATCYGNVRAELERTGQPIGAYDLLIAAHALYSKSTLVTNNTKEFGRVPGLEIEDWF